MLMIRGKLKLFSIFFSFHVLLATVFVAKMPNFSKFRPKKQRFAQDKKLCKMSVFQVMKMMKAELANSGMSEEEILV
jgi:hypothetical protein